MTAPVDAPVSVFRSGINATPVERLPLTAMLARIQDGTYQQRIDALRAFLAMEDGKRWYDDRKKTLPAFTPAGVFTRRANTRLTEASGLVHFDFDHPPNLAEVKSRLMEDPWIAYAFISPSGDGLKVAVWADGIGDDPTYKHAWGTVLEYFQRTYPDLAVANDAHCKDIARLCFVSHDPELYINPDARLYAVPRAQAATPKARPARTASSPRPQTAPTGAGEQARVEDALQVIPADDYDTWLRVGMALHSSSEAWARAVWDTWSARSDKYDAHAQDEKWASFSPDGGVNLATLFHLAQQHGYTSPRQATLRVKRQSRPTVPDMTGPPAETQDAPAPDEEPPLDEHIYGAASRPARDPDALPYSDYTNALAFVRDHGTNLRYCFPWGKWLTWTGTHWQIDDTGRVMRWAKETVKRLARHAEDLDDLSAIGTLLKHVKASLSTPKLKALVENAQSELPLPVLPEDLDRDRWLLNATNGTVDLRTGALQPHRREDLLTRCIPVAYDKDAVCPTWDSFLERIMAGNANLISFLQRAVGYALTGVIREHVLLILWGSGRNGKSTFLGTLLALLGAYAMKAPSELLMVSYNDRHPTERADLFHKRFVATIETEQGRRMAETFVKEATGGDTIRARRMREDFWEFDPTHKLFLATNHKPVITGTDNAIWERMRLIPFTVTIPINERDTTLPDKLRAELPGILVWAVRGCQAWQQDGLGEPDEVHQATAGYRVEMDVLGAFIEECCLTGPNYRVKASDLYDAYKRWCDQRVEHIDPQRTWGMALTERGYERYPNNGTWYRGIAVRHTALEEPEGDLRKERNQRNQKTGLNTSEIHFVNTIPEIGSVPSVPSVDVHKDDPARDDLRSDSIAVGDYAYLFSADGAQQNVEPYFCIAIEPGSDGLSYARFMETDTGWLLTRCTKAPPLHAFSEGVPPI